MDCQAGASPPGTTATFRCRELFELLYDFQPAAGYRSVCGQDGYWSVPPFKCVPGNTNEAFVVAIDGLSTANVEE